jgi:hypothetical protein
MRVVDNAIDHRGQMLGHADHQSSCGQFIDAQMHSATRADLHGRRPHPTERFHDSLDGRFINARSRVAHPTFSFAGAFVDRRAVYHVVNLLVRPARGNRYRADNTIPSLALVSGRQPSPIIKLKMSAHVSSALWLVSVFCILSWGGATQTPMFMGRYCKFAACGLRKNKSPSSSVEVQPPARLASCVSKPPPQSNAEQIRSRMRFRRIPAASNR